MAREVIIASWCDPCLTEDSKRVESTRSLTVQWIGVPRPQQIDVCERHAEVITSFMIFMDKYGRNAEVDDKPMQPLLLGEKEKATRRSPAPSTARQQRLIDVPGAMGCPECFVLYSPGENGKPRHKYVATHLKAKHDKSITEYSDADLAEATAKAITKIKLTMP